MQQAPLKLAQDITNIVNDAYTSWELFEKVSPITQELLKFWFDEEWTTTRNINFHNWQKQAILNTIYLTEVLKVKNVKDIYMQISPDLLLEKEIWLSYIENDRFSYPRYCYKMATWTGKTWVLSALLIWQYLNYIYNKENQIETDILFSPNFLIVAPGLIVYERLLDAFCGKEENGIRNFETSDFKRFKDLFIPEDYQDQIFSFISSSIVKKDEIWKKITWDGQIIITNWHIFLENEENLDEEIIDPFKEANKIIKNILPATPWKATWNSLDVLDKKALWKAEIEYLKSLKNLVVFNDEAHHLWENKTEDKKRQQAMNEISENKKGSFLQLDFTATPYIQKWKEKILFPHIIVNFDIVQAMKQWLIKSLVLDKRKETSSIKSEDLDFKAVRDESNKVISLSNWQEIMIQAWLEKRKILEESFKKEWKDKTPKMLIICEDTEVVPFVENYLKNLWYAEEEFASIHSNKKWEIFEEDKKKVFALDKWENPKIVISVLMLREWFDVNNICVIVPLRSSQSWILLEQTIGRWLRLMWRWDPALDEVKAENRKRIFVEKKSPLNYFDILSVVEHPAFEQFYNDLMEEGEVLFWVDENDLDDDSSKVLWDIETLNLKENYKEFDISFPIIVSDVEEVLKKPEYSIDMLNSYHIDFKELKKLAWSKEKFVSQAVISWTRFWDYDVDIGIMTADSYNDFLARLTRKVADAVGWWEINIKKNTKHYNLMQINLPALTKLIDDYIREKLFFSWFNPMVDNNWKVLMIDDVAKFVIKELIQVVEQAQEVEIVWEPEVIFRNISEVETIKVRKKYSIQVAKSIFDKLPYPSNKWWLEKEFIEFADTDSLTESFCKIFEFKHTFMRMRYIQESWIPAYYYPDFIVKTKEKIYLVETKATSNMNNENVKRKKNATLTYISRINKLPESLRWGKIWEYVLLSEDKFYSYKKNWANIVEMLEAAKLLDLKTMWWQVAIF